MQDEVKGVSATVCRVSIIIVNWNTQHLLRGCLASIFQQTTADTFEVIVVDNASSDGSAEMVRREFPQVILIANTSNRGFAAANNQGLRCAKGEYLLLLNPDTVILDHAIDKAIAFTDSEIDIGVMGCQVMETPQRIQRTCFAFPSPLNILLEQTGLSSTFPRSRIFGKAWLGWWDRRSRRDVDVVSGMFMLVRRAAMEEVGLMDEAYFVYAEEADWCYRFWKAGWRCVFAPVAQIIHLDGGGKSTSQVSARMYVQLQKSLLHFHRKHYGWLAWMALRLLYACSNAARAISWGVLAWLRRAEAPRHRRNQAVAALKFQLFGVGPQ